MPFRSESQRRKFYLMADRGEISKETLKKWEDATPDKKLLGGGEKKPMEKAAKLTGLKSVGRFLFSPKGAITAGSLGVAGSGYRLHQLHKERKDLIKKLPEVMSTPIVGPGYNPKKDIKAAEKVLGQKIDVIDAARITDEQAHKLRWVFGGILAPITSADIIKSRIRKAATGNAFAYISPIKAMKGEMVNPLVVVGPGVSRSVLLHELGHLVDFKDRKDRGLPIMRNWKGDESSLVEREKAAWKNARKMAPEISKDMDHAESVALGTYRNAVSMSTPLLLSAASLAMLAAGLKRSGLADKGLDKMKNAYRERLKRGILGKIKGKR